MSFAIRWRQHFSSEELMASNNNKKAQNIKNVPDNPAHSKAAQKKAEQSPKKQSVFAALLPYILMLFALILAICFVTVRLLGMDDGAGVIGYGIQWFFCGLLGPAAFVLPAAVFYIGLRMCIYNVKWTGGSKRAETAENNRAKDRRAFILATVMGLLIVTLISAMCGVNGDDYGGLDVAGMWTDAADDLSGGGLVGGALGLLFVTCFEKLISNILLVIFIIVCAFFLSGFTPATLAERIMQSIEARRERRAEEEEEALRLAAEAEAEARKHKNRMAASQMRQSAPAATMERPNTAPARKITPVDEILNDDDDVEEIEELELKPLDINKIYATPSNKSADEMFIGTDGKLTRMPSQEAKAESSAASEKAGEDFGGDPTFDTNEFAGVKSIIDGLNSGNATVKSSVQESAEINLTVQKKATSVDELLDGFDEKPKKEAREPEKLNLEQIENEELLSEMAAVAPEESTEEDIAEELVIPYVFPPVDMLTPNPNSAEEDYSAELNENAQRLLQTLASFKVSIDAITYSRGPTITRYELKPAAGTRVRAIANLVDDIALSLATTGVRIEAPIPNKPAVGIEVPNRTRATVYLRDLIDSPKFFESKSRLTASLGMDVGGNPIYFDISKMPHMLIAGATGMGKSVCINTIIVSLLYKAKPEELKLILIDPKKVEFNIYKNIPHLYAPIVSDPKKAAGALASAVAEMERRFELIEAAGVRDIAGYNATIEADPTREFMPHMVIIIDELADLMMTAPDEVETSICRLAQKARAAGIHIIIGTQRPSVDVITGLIKANIPSRIACTVASQTDSRTILDGAGAEKLIGRGDMLFAPVGASKPMRVQGAFVSEGEVENIVTFIRDNNKAGKFNAEFIKMIDEKAAQCGNKKGAQGGGSDFDTSDSDEGGDSKFQDAVKLAIEEGKIATSLLQRRLGVGYGRAAKIIDAMEERGYVSKPDGNKPRRVLITMEEYMRRVVDGTIK